MNPLSTAISRFLRLPHHGCGRMAVCGGKPNRKHKRTGLLVEQLEDRAVPTASISIADVTVKEQGNLSVFASGDASVFARPSGLVFGPDRNKDGVPDLYASRNDNSKNITVYDGNTGAFVEEFANSSSGLNRTGLLTIGPDGALYVPTDPGSGTFDTILRIDQSKAVTTFISPNNPGGNGGLSSACGMTFGPDDNFYVVSRGTTQVLRYHGTTGAFIDAFVASGSGGLSLPGCLDFGPDRDSDTVPDLYVSSVGTNQVLVYSGSNGSFLDVFVAAGSGGLNGPWDMKFGADGNLYVDSTGTHYEQILRFDGTSFDGTSGGFIDTPIATGSGMGPEVAVFAIDRQGELYAVSGRANEILHYATGPLVSLSESSSTPITVDFITTDGTAIHGSDYATIGGRLTFAPGETSKRILISAVDDGVTEPSETFTINLSNASGAATIADGQGVVTILNTQTKFFVIDDAPINDRTYEYESTGAAIAPNWLDYNNTAPRGIAANAAGTRYWVADLNKNVFVYDNNGVLLGSWSAGGLNINAQIEGIATNGTDIWLLDNNQDKVYKYSGAASLLAGSQNAASSFNLVNGKNSNGKGLVTDGTYLWVVDDATTDKVFKYTVSGTSKGSWTIDPANTHPTGLTINPNNVSDIWIVDSGTKKVYQYTNAAGRTSGSQNAATTFALAAGNTNPQDIADPPAPDMMLTTTPIPENATDPLLQPVRAEATGDGLMTETLPPGVRRWLDTLATAGAQTLALSPGLVDWLAQTTPVASTSSSDSGQPAFHATIAPPAEGTLSAGRPAAQTSGPRLMPTAISISPHRDLDQVFSDPALGLIDDALLRCIAAGV